MKKSTLKIKLLFVLLLTIGFIMLGRTNYSYCANEETFTMNAKINPIYEDVLSEKEKEYIKDELNTLSNGKKYKSSINNTYNATTYTSYGTLVNAVKSNMVKRNNQFIFIWKEKKLYNNSSFANFIGKLALDATSEKYAKTSDEGNYLRLHFTGWGYQNVSWKYDKKTKYYTYTVPLRMTYYTTASQEAELNKVVNEYVTSYKNSGTKSKYQIIYDFNNYVCDNLTYDYTNLNNDYYDLKYTAYAALINGTAVCQGYASLYYKLLDNMGINNTVVTSNQMNHIWNLVEYNGKWYHIDTTWNDGSDKAPYTNYFLWGKSDYPADHKYSDVTVNWKETTPKYNIAYRGIGLDESAKVSSFTATPFDKANPTLNWKVPTGVGGIDILDADTNKLLGHFTNTQTSMPFPNVIIGKIYNFEIYTWKLVNGKEQYSAPTKLTVFTKPNAVTGVRATSAGVNYITIAWNKYPKTNVAGYKIYKYNPSKKKYEYCKKTTSTSCKVTGLKTLNNYMFRVVAYLNVNGKEYNGKDTALLKTGTSTKVPSISKLSTKKKKVTISWKKVSGVSRYEIYMKTSSKGSYKKIKTATSKTTKYTKSKLKKGEKCWVKIRTYRTVNGKRVYSPYSKVKSIKVK